MDAFQGEILLAVLAGLGVTFAAVMAFRAWKKSRDAKWGEVARRLGLQWTPPSIWSSPKIVGIYEGMRVTIDQYTQGSGKSQTTYTRFRLSSHALPSMAGFTPEGFGSGFKRFFGAEDHEIADSDLDAQLMINGDPVEASAMFDHTSRLAVAQFQLENKSLTSRGIRLEDGILIHEYTGSGFDPDKVVHLVTSMGDIARSLEIPNGNIPERLRKNTLEDPNPYVARKNLEHLRAYPEIALATARELLNDVRPPVVTILAAQIVGREGTEVLGKIACTSSVPDTFRSQAIEALSRFPDAPSFEPALKVCLDEERGSPLREKALSLASDAQLSAVADYALSSQFSSESAAEAMALARLLRHSDSAEAQTRLVKLLNYDDTDVKIGASESLGVVGSITAVESLMPYTKGMFESGTLKDAAKDAITAIQSRLSGADQGQVSVVSTQDDRGAVSVERTQGEVSLAEEPA